MEILAVSGTTRKYYCFFSVLLVSCFLTLSLAKPSTSFAYKRFNEKTLSFDTEIGLYGDAKVVNTTSGGSVEINGYKVWSTGKVVHRKPIKLGNRKNPVSFSSYFSFSISSENGDGLAFMLIPKGVPLENGGGGGGSFGLGDELVNNGSKVFAVEFDTLKNVEYGDQNGNHVGIDSGSLVSVKTSNASSVNVVLNSGKKLHSWVDYDASSKRLEVRLCNFTEGRPNDPLIWHQIDLSRMWKEEEEVFVGIGSSSGNSTQTSSVYSWSFRLRRVPTWMHSEPLDPQVYSHETKPPIIHTRTICAFKIVTALLFGIGCGALAASVMLFLWTVFANKRAAVVPAEYPDRAVEYGYEKIKVVTEKAANDGKK